MKNVSILGRNLFAFPIMILTASILGFINFACSSDPDRNVIVVEIFDGKELMKNADDLLRRNQIDYALKNYSMAYNKFSLADYSEGKMNAAIGVMKCYLRFNDFDAAEEWLIKLNPISGLSDNFFESSSKAKVLFQYSKKNFETIVELTQPEAIANFSLENRTEMVAYRTLSLLELKKNYKQDFFELTNLLVTMQKEKNDGGEFNPYSLSFIYYTLGFISYKENVFDKAFDYFSTALEFDKTYSNYSGIADDLFAIGMTSKEMNNSVAAISSFERAAEIYELINAYNSYEKSKYESALLLLQNKDTAALAKKTLKNISEKTSDEELKKKINEILR